MTQSKHTPAPWHASKSGGTPNFWAISFDAGDIAFLTLQEENLEANAHLIAAAPELLEALEYELEVRKMRNDPNNADVFEEGELTKYEAVSKTKMLKAIAKARGQS